MSRVNKFFEGHKLSHSEPRVGIIEEVKDQDVCGKWGNAMKQSSLEAEFLQTWQAIGGCPLEAEYRFHAKRRWRLDFAEPVTRIAFEIDGGVWSGGRHNRGAGYIEDCYKINAAQMDGWTVIRLTRDMLQPAYLEELAEALGLWGAEGRATK